MKASRKNSSAKSWSYYLLIQQVAMNASRKAFVFISLTADPHWKWLSFPALTFFCTSGRGQWYGSNDSNHDDALRRGGSSVRHHVMSFFLFKISKFFKSWCCEKIEKKHASEIGIMHLDKSAKIVLSKQTWFSQFIIWILNLWNLQQLEQEHLPLLNFSVQLGIGAMTWHWHSSDLVSLVDWGGGESFYLFTVKILYPWVVLFFIHLLLGIFVF